MSKDYKAIEDRLVKLLDIGLAQLRKDDIDGAVLVLQEALKTAEQLPQKKEHS